MKRVLASAIPPSSGTRFPALDGLRGVAVLMVLSTHAFVWFGPGGIGVCIFFALSAFLLYYPWTATGPRDLWGYYRRRVFRIYPAWLVAILAGTLVMSALGKAPSLSGFLAHLGFIHSWYRPWRWAIDPPAWSMGPEVQFYLILPLVAWAIHRSRHLLWLSILGAIAAQALIPKGHTMWLNLPLLFLPFGLGLVAAQCVRRNVPIPAILGVLILAAVCYYHQTVGLSLALNTPAPAGVVPMLLNPRGLIPSLAALVAIVGLTRPSRITAIFAWTPLRMVGICGYGVFLLHWPILLATRALLPGPLGVGMGVLLSLAAGVASYIYIEAPAMRRHHAKPVGLEIRRQSVLHA